MDRGLQSKGFFSRAIDIIKKTALQKSVAVL